ncbi:MAG: hypothetical protein JWP37_2987, partial [Mucilaginibacter sp.]|nr:hypothetical protein [Mucilaginibacter sp.]
MKISKSTSKRSVARLGVVCLLSVLLSSCLKDNNKTYITPPAALVTFIQASPDEPPLNFFLNNNRVNINPLGYGSQIDYFRAFTGHRTVNFYNSTTMATILQDTVYLNANVTYSLFLANTASHPEILLLTDSISRPASGKATVRFVNLSPNAPPVDLVNAGTTMVSNKAYKGFSSFLPVDGNKGYTFTVVQHGTSTVLATLANVNLNSNTVYTIWFHG